jgi:ABC-type glycerol-3-phosphate transport system substrate-binding protein
MSRRGALKLGAATAALPLVHIRTGHAAGKLTIGFWDHWIPGANDTLNKQVMAWGAANQVDVKVDFITSNGFKNLITLTAEQQAKTGHDINYFPNFEAHNHQEMLEPVDDVMKQLLDAHGPVLDTNEYLYKIKGHWMTVPASWGAQDKGPCARISIMKATAGIDLLKMYPAAAVKTPEADAWTWDAHQKAAEACQKAGKTFGIGLGVTADSVDTAGGLFRAYGAALVNAKGDVTLDTPEMDEVMAFAQRMVRALPEDAVAYDDASNNRALISGDSALVWNPPSAWAVAVRDNRAVGEDLWTFPAPKGPKARVMPQNLTSWGIWSFSQNKTAAKTLLAHLMSRPQVEGRSEAVQGYDLPPFKSMMDFKIWETVGPPPGTVYNYPIRASHDMIPWISGMDAPPEIAVQIYNRGTLPTMLAKLKTGQTVKQAKDWAREEIEGFMR